MSLLSMQGGATGTGTVSLVAPVTNTNRMLTLPDVTDTVAGIAATQTLTNKTLTSPTLTTPNVNSAQVDTVSGTAPLYFCRAWVNFNGTGTVTIRGSGNVTQVNDNGTGDYTVVFTTAIADTNYAVCFGGVRPTNNYFIGGASSFATTSVNINTWTVAPAAIDCPTVCVSIFR